MYNFFLLSFKKCNKLDEYCIHIFTFSLSNYILKQQLFYNKDYRWCH